MTGLAASWILLIVPLLALAVLCLANEAPDGSGPLGTQETMSKIIGLYSYRLLRGVGFIPFAPQGLLISRLHDVGSIVDI